MKTFKNFNYLVYSVCGRYFELKVCKCIMSNKIITTVDYFQDMCLTIKYDFYRTA